MGREKPNYRDMLQFLYENDFPLVMNKKEVMERLNISSTTLNNLIRRGDIKISENKITIGSLARYLCD